MKVYVKHEALTERGKGNAVTFNIEIKSAPQSLPEAMRLKESNWLTAQQIAHWEVKGPQYPSVDLYFDKNPD